MKNHHMEQKTSHSAFLFAMASNQSVVGDIKCSENSSEVQSSFCLQHCYLLQRQFWLQMPIVDRLLISVEFFRLVSNGERWNGNRDREMLQSDNYLISRDLNEGFSQFLDGKMMGITKLYSDRGFFEARRTWCGNKNPEN